jgi:hypothetical protein
MKSFFDLIVPASGYKFIATISEGQVRHHACKSAVEMVRIASQASLDGVDAYFSCASFAQPEYVDGKGVKRRRTAHNALAAKSFWLDIDVGEDKPYSDQHDAIVALISFCSAHELPKPMLVSSGAGLHCYWPMTDDVPKAKWCTVASKLKELTKDPGQLLMADPSRTSDIASILRPVGTRNFKRRPAVELVKVLADVRPISVDQFTASVDAAFNKLISTALGSNVTRSLAAHIDIKGAEGCLRHIDPDRGDRADWWTIVAALADAFGESGRDLARSWSRGDFMPQPSERYDVTDFNGQFDDCLARDHFDGARAGLGTIIWLARRAGWMGGSPEWMGELNDQFAWIEKESAIYRLKFGDLIRTADFRQQLANKIVEVLSGDKPKHAAAGDAWLRHSARRQHDRVVMRPAAPPVTTDNCLNVWSGFRVDSAPGDVRPFFTLLDRLIPDPDARGFVCSWLAHLLQRPHIKMSVALVIWSREQGVGKNLLFECIAKIIGERHATKIEQAELASAFNGWARDKILVIGDEVIGEDRRQHADKLKGLITGTTIQINEKHRPVTEIENLANFIFLSNHPTAMFVGQDDRRYFVWEIEASPMSPTEAKAFAAWRDHGGLSALRHHLQSLEISSFNPKARAPTTVAKKVMVDSNRSDVEVWADQVVSSGAEQLIGREVASAMELADCYERTTGRPKPSAKTITSTFKRLGAYQRPSQVRVGTTKLRLIAIDRPEHWRDEPESSWAAEMGKPLGPHLLSILPQQCLANGTQVQRLPPRKAA